jgi:tRNA(fMet)-specific endonuclease VapC
MRYMLDTDTCIYLIKEKPAHVLRRFRSLRVSDIGVSAITCAELQHGVEKSARPRENALALVKFLTPLEIAAFDDMAAADYGTIRAALEREGRVIGAMDLLIAAHARSLGVILITNNIDEFKRVAGLALENWATLT